MDIKVNNGRKSAILNFIEMICFQGTSLSEAAHFVLYQWANRPVFPDILDIKVNNGRKSAILNFIEMICFQGTSLSEAAHFVLY